MTDKYQILEPLSSMVELALLNFSKEEPKIVIKNHGINLDTPNDRYIPQSISRFFGGDSKEDIFVLNSMIVNYIKWFIIDNHNDKFDIYKDIALCAVSGMRKLQHTYKTGNVVLALQYYIVLIMKAISDCEYVQTNNYEEDNKEDDGYGYNTYSDAVNNERTKQDDLDRFSDHDSEFMCDNAITSKESLNLWILPMQKMESIVDVEKIKDIWSSNDIDNLHKMLCDCFDMTNRYKFTTKSNTFVTAQINALTEVLKHKDKTFNDIIRNSYGGK
jgi:hypothetical protein